MSAFEIRRADLSDADGVAQVWLQSRADAAAYIPEPAHSDTEVRAWIAGPVLGECECWVAEAAGGEIVAMLVLEEGWIDQLYVAPDRQGLGIGSALVELAKRRSPEGLQLWTFQSNLPARRFYERHGFVRVETTDGSGNEERAPDIRYVSGAVRS